MCNTDLSLKSALSNNGLGKLQVASFLLAYFVVLLHGRLNTLYNWLCEEFMRF